ncbi:MAG: hypothetical protein KC593_01105 [Myxococcales bacterium]|nr:hypothetical protein [Myxococcales bacterium]MCB9629127.1 hypothetical protein [Sandaracinaceae bacterium]
MSSPTRPSEPAPGSQTARRWARRIATGVAVVTLVGGLAALGLWLWVRVPPTDASPEEAMAVFAEVLNGATERRPSALSALAGALAREPQNGRVQLYFGLANLHGFLEHREMPYAIRASRAFARAAVLLPDDPSAEGWRAFFEYQAAESREEDLREPTRALLAAAAADPSFTSFLAAVALADRPLASGLPQQTLAPLEAAGACADGTTYGCRTGPLFPHGAEGYHATLGDLRVRLGDLEGGRQSYARALEMPAADSWPYRAQFERWVEGAEARAAAFADADTTNDPDVFFAHGPRACAACHER